MCLKMNRGNILHCMKRTQNKIKIGQWRLLPNDNFFVLPADIVVHVAFVNCRHSPIPPVVPVTLLLVGFYNLRSKKKNCTVTIQYRIILDRMNYRLVWYSNSHCKFKIAVGVCIQIIGLENRPWWLSGYIAYVILS